MNMAKQSISLSADGSISDHRTKELSNIMDTLDITSTSAGRTRSIGKRIGGFASAGEVILLVGALGTGKTCLTQGIALGLGIKDYVVSPSFVLLREYNGRLPLYHIDLYRLESIEEIVSLGLDDYLYYSRGISVIEWADKGWSVLPTEHMRIDMDYIDTNRRKLTFSPEGQRYSEMLNRLRNIFRPKRK